MIVRYGIDTVIHDKAYVRLCMHLALWFLHRGRVTSFCYALSSDHGAAQRKNERKKMSDEPLTDDTVIHDMYACKLYLYASWYGSCPLVLASRPRLASRQGHD